MSNDNVVDFTEMLNKLKDTETKMENPDLTTEEKLDLAIFTMANLGLSLTMAAEALRRTLETVTGITIQDAMNHYMKNKDKDDPTDV